MGGGGPDLSGMAGWIVLGAVVLGFLVYRSWRHPSSDTRSVATSPNGSVPVTRPAGETHGLPVPPSAPSATPAEPESLPAPQVYSPHLFLGNPSNAAPDPAMRDNYLMVKRGYALSYNNSKGTPNWVSWKLELWDMGRAPRKQLFDPDGFLPSGFFRVTTGDYRGSGFDRGHLCPHSDRDATAEMSDETFTLTNIIPQAPNVNQRAWATLENYCRALVRESDGRVTLFQIAGPWGQGGVGSKGRSATIGGGRIVVPAVCWKVIVAVPTERSRDPATLRGTERVIAVRMLNENALDTPAWAGFRVRAADIERETGYTFFSNAPPQAAERLRQALDDNSIPVPAIPVHPGRGR